ncbi:ubiquitin-protein ligase [Lithospermum erythrorhizon]|uniref:E3 ubiquitin-protein ligase n=1 Tax=Lithospermum erythrorhizon TaxID=34254 RepID=A0AAV3QCP6_LITER
MIPKLPEKISNLIMPVMDQLLSYWKKSLMNAETKDRLMVRHPELVNEITISIVDMFMELHSHSYSMFRFLCERVLSARLLAIIVRAEGVLTGYAVNEVHKLVLKFMYNQHFKYNLGKFFMTNYSEILKHAMRFVQKFATKIITDPILATPLVDECNGLSILFDSLEHVFSTCAGEDNILQVSKLTDWNNATFMVLKHIRLFMSHSKVTKYMLHDKGGILRSWMKLLSFVQGMNPLKRQKSIHIEEANTNVSLPFSLSLSIAKINSLLVAGAFANINNFEDQDNVRHWKVSRLSGESSSIFSSSLVQLTHECMMALEDWFRVENKEWGILWSRFRVENKEWTINTNIYENLW